MTNEPEKISPKVDVSQYNRREWESGVTSKTVDAYFSRLGIDKPPERPLTLEDIVPEGFLRVFTASGPKIKVPELYSRLGLDFGSSGLVGDNIGFEIGHFGNYTPKDMYLTSEALFGSPYSLEEWCEALVPVSLIDIVKSRIERRRQNALQTYTDAYTNPPKARKSLGYKILERVVLPIQNLFVFYFSGGTEVLVIPNEEDMIKDRVAKKFSEIREETNSEKFTEDVVRSVLSSYFYYKLFIATMGVEYNVSLPPDYDYQKTKL